MTSRDTRRTAPFLLLAAALAGTPLAASAQAPAAPSTPAATAQDRRAAARAEARITELHAKLRITAAQQPQWDAFTAVMRDNARHTEQVMMARSDVRSSTALDDMRGFTATAVAHAADMQRMLPVFEALYNSMSPEQQKLTDAVFRQQEWRRRR